MFTYTLTKVVRITPWLQFLLVPLLSSKSNQIRFTLYPAHSGVGEGNLENLRILEALFLSGETQRRVASIPERRNENINLNKYFIASSEALTHNQSILQSHFVPLRHGLNYYYYQLYGISVIYISVYFTPVLL